MNVIFLKILCAVFALLQPITAKNNLFTVASISFKNVAEKSFVKYEYKNLKTIDYNGFGNAAYIQVNTDHMVLHEEAVKNLPHLKILRLKECGIQYIFPKAFKNLPSLEILRLEENDLTTIKTGVFNNLSIRELRLQKNEITDIESEAFDNMPNLEIIRLNHNFLLSWDTKWFKNTPMLAHLAFRRNKITSLPPRAFTNIKATHKRNGLELIDTKIFLTYNDISNIDPEAFDGIEALDILSLKGNKIKKIDRKVFSHMKILRKLNLENNQLTEIDETNFENLNNMFVLNLGLNNFTCLPYEIVSVAENVKMSGNPQLKCACLENLKRKLEENHLKTIIKHDRNCV